MGMFVHSYYLSALSGGMKRERGERDVTGFHCQSWFSYTIKQTRN